MKREVHDMPRKSRATDSGGATEADRCRVRDTLRDWIRNGRSVKLEGQRVKLDDQWATWDFHAVPDYLIAAELDDATFDVKRALHALAKEGAIHRHPKPRGDTASEWRMRDGRIAREAVEHDGDSRAVVVSIDGQTRQTMRMKGELAAGFYYGLSPARGRPDRPPASSPPQVLSDTQQRILEYLAKSGKTEPKSRMSATDLADDLNLSIDTLKRPLAALVKGGLLAVAKGRDGGYWLTGEQWCHTINTP
jgi:uncharacterized protein YjhX (UPF0386 family)